MTDVTILPADNQPILIKLIEGQAAGQTEMRIQNQRLFGGDGQIGAIPFMQKQHERLEETISKGFADLAELIRNDKEKQDGRINSLENKQYFMAGIGTVAGSFVGWFANWFKHS